MRSVSLVWCVAHFVRPPCCVHAQCGNAYRRDTGYSRYVHSESLPAPPMGRGKDSRARSGSAPGRGPYSRAAQERSASGPRDRGFPHGRVSSSLPNIQEPLPAPPTGSGPGAPPNRTPERSQRSSGARNGSKDSSNARDRNRDVSHGSRDTAQRGYSSSSRPSRAASGATGHSPMRSSGGDAASARSTHLSSNVCGCDYVDKHYMPLSSNVCSCDCVDKH